jgi:hypothetical protein
MSEVATYQLLRNTTIPIPRVFEFACEGNANGVGVGYILMEKMPGHTMDWSHATQQQKKHICGQLVDIYLQLEKLQMPYIGRPVFETHTPGQIVVGPAFFDYDANGTCVHHGPFSTSIEWYRAFLSHQKGLAERGEIATSATNNALLAYRYLDDCLNSDVVDENYNSGPFYLKHPDTREDNFLVDDNYTITGIIDWEESFFAPKGSAFQSPLFMFDMSHVLDGSQSSPDSELFAEQFEAAGHSDLAQLVREGKKTFLFEQCVETDPAVGSLFAEQLCAMWEMMDGVTGDQTWESWQAMIRRRHGDGETSGQTMAMMKDGIRQ